MDGSEKFLKCADVVKGWSHTWNFNDLSKFPGFVKVLYGCVSAWLWFGSIILGYAKLGRFLTDADFLQ